MIAQDTPGTGKQRIDILGRYISFSLHVNYCCLHVVCTYHFVVVLHWVRLHLKAGRITTTKTKWTPLSSFLKRPPYAVQTQTNGRHLQKNPASRNSSDTLHFRPHALVLSAENWYNRWRRKGRPACPKEIVRGESNEASTPLACPAPRSL